MISFAIDFAKGNLHKLRVRLYSSTRGLRRAVRRTGEVNLSSDVLAATLWAKPVKPVSVIIEIALATERLTYNDVAHECVHAAIARAAWLGCPKDDPEYEEFVACCAGDITDSVLRELQHRKIRVRYETL